ncbi:hypothetical protein SAMN06264855_12721 [Halorubrum vacuolatum]|uniref:Phage integrase, N-terminal SAM-like domain n=1 Tax=Halorubrum vacuolatum TaxID=63740 RepID=A0A238Y0R4_HALVU|nr:hypothetical protein SAMN06264855_12721 [Halorubrum vacuolatum]
MTRPKGTKPEEFSGVYQSYSDIPVRYRLETYADSYQNKETWNDYCSEVLFAKFDSNHIRDTAKKAGKSWLAHMDARGRHHALATPLDVDTWSQELMNGNRNRRTCYEQYFVRIYQFYDYLKQSYQHPHLYNPCLIAAINYETTRYLWDYRVDVRPEVRPRE